MTDNPQEPNSFDPELPLKDQQDQSHPADDLDELRKNISTQELIEKHEISPSFFKRMTKPLTGAINKLHGTSSLDPNKPPITVKSGALPGEDLEDSLFDRVLPPTESLPGVETNAMLPDWTEEQSTTSASDLSIPLGMPFHNTLNELDLDTSGDSPNPEGKTWIFGREEEQDDGLSDLEELLKPSDFQTTDTGSSSEDTLDQDKVTEIQKPHGWRSLITGILGRPKPSETTQQPEPNEMDDTVMSSRLGLSGPDQTAEPALDEETLPGTEDTLWDENQQFNIQPEETPWYDQRPDIILEDITEDEYQRFGFGMLLKYDAPDDVETGTPTLTEDQESEDVMRNLQADRSELVEGAEFAFQMSFDDDFEASLQEYKPDIQFEQDYDDENVTAYWGPSAGDQEEEVEAEFPLETATLDDMREVVLEEYDAVGADSSIQSEGAQKLGLLGYFSRLEVIILTFLIVAILAVVAGLVLIQNGMLAGFKPSESPTIATEQVFVPNGPYPTGIEITGGWYLPLNPSTVVEGKWLPKSAEWLTGSEIRRLVALPWNRQLEAVILTLVPGDTINLYFNNDKAIVYRVEKVERITASSTSQLQDLTPSLLIILAKEDSTHRWVLTCTPIDIP